MRRRSLSAVLGLLALMALGGSSSLADSQRSHGTVHVNELQVIGTHNSYHREISKREQAAYDAAIDTPGDYDAYLAYSHATLPRQLGSQDVRGLELDLLGDPAGGLYAEPLIRTRLGLGPLPDPAWRAPGIKVLHIPDVDYNTTCVQLVNCLRQVRDWSQAHPGHVPIPIMLELKGSDPRVVAAGGVVAPAWDRAALDALDAEIRSVFTAGEMITLATSAVQARRSSSRSCARAGRRCARAAARSCSCSTTTPGRSATPTPPASRTSKAAWCSRTRARA